MTLLSRQFYFPLQYDGINYSSWSDTVTSGKAHIPHNYSWYWPLVHQWISNLGYLAAALKRALSLSLAGVGLQHRQSCVVYLCLNPEQSHRGQSSGRTAAKKTAPLIPCECLLIAVTTSWVNNERNPPVSVGCTVPFACFQWDGAPGRGRPGPAVDSRAQMCS